MFELKVTKGEYLATLGDHGSAFLGDIMGNINRENTEHCADLMTPRGSDPVQVVELIRAAKACFRAPAKRVRESFSRGLHGAIFAVGTENCGPRDPYRDAQSMREWERFGSWLKDRGLYWDSINPGCVGIYSIGEDLFAGERS